MESSVSHWKLPGQLQRLLSHHAVQRVSTSSPHYRLKERAVFMNCKVFVNFQPTRGKVCSKNAVHFLFLVSFGNKKLAHKIPFSRQKVCVCICVCFVYLGIVPGISPSCTAFTQNALSLDEHTPPNTLSPSRPYPSLLWVLLSNCLP